MPKPGEKCDDGRTHLDEGAYVFMMDQSRIVITPEDRSARTFLTGRALVELFKFLEREMNVSITMQQNEEEEAEECPKQDLPW